MGNIIEDFLNGLAYGSGPFGIGQQYSDDYLINQMPISGYSDLYKKDPARFQQLLQTAKIQRQKTGNPTPTAIERAAMVIVPLSQMSPTNNSNNSTGMGTFRQFGEGAMPTTGAAPQQAQSKVTTQLPDTQAQANRTNATGGANGQSVMAPADSNSAYKAAMAQGQAPGSAGPMFNKVPGPNEPVDQFTDPRNRLFSGDDPEQSMRSALGGNYNFFGGSPQAKFLQSLADPMFMQYVMSDAGSGQEFSPQRYQQQLSGGSMPKMDWNSLVNLSNSAIGGAGGADPSMGVGKYLATPGGAVKALAAGNYFNTPGGSFRDAYAQYLRDRATSMSDQAAPPDNYLAALLGR